MQSNLMESAGNALKGIGKVMKMKLRQNRSGIGMAAGIILLAGGTIWACTKTEDAKKVIDEAKKDKADVDSAYEKDIKEAEGDEIRVKEVTRERAVGYMKLGGKCAWGLIKVYAGPGGVWIGGLGSVIWSYSDEKQERKKLLADSVLIKKLFDEYRARNREKIGEEEEKELYFAVQEGSFETEEVDPKTGNKKKVKKKRKIIGENGGSKFARNFSARTSYEFDVRSYADYFIALKIEELNKKLKSVPFITMNEVYDELGMKPEYGRCQDGLDWGWVYNPMDPDGPNEIVITWMEGWEESWNDKTNSVDYIPCMRIDFNPQYLIGKI